MEKEKTDSTRLGIPQGQAYAWSSTGMGRWAVANSPILGTTVTIQKAQEKGVRTYV